MVMGKRAILLATGKTDNRRPADVRIAPALSGTPANDRRVWYTGKVEGQMTEYNYLNDLQSRECHMTEGPQWRELSVRFKAALFAVLDPYENSPLGRLYSEEPQRDKSTQY